MSGHLHHQPAVQRKIAPGLQWVVVSLCLAAGGVVFAADKKPVGDSLLESSAAHVFNGADGGSVPYRLFSPKEAKPEQKFPLVLCLHSGLGRGTDNATNIKHCRAFQMLAQAKNQEQHPCYLVCPQSPWPKEWIDWSHRKGSYSLDKVAESPRTKIVVELLKQLVEELPIDPDRVYVTGDAIGGFATFDLLMRYPDLFAAAIPSYGGGDPTQAKRIAHIPLWCFDAVRSGENSAGRAMVEAVNKEGGMSKHTVKDCKIDILDGVVWTTTPELIPWLFEQKRKR